MAGENKAPWHFIPQHWLRGRGDSIAKKIPGVGQAAWEYLVNFIWFLLVAFVILVVMITGVINVPALDPLYRSSNPLLAFFFPCAACSALFGLIASVFDNHEFTIPLPGNDIRLRIPDSIARYIFKSPWWLTLFVLLATSAWTGFLLLQINCKPPVVVFVHVEKEAIYQARDVIRIDRSSSITFQAEFTNGKPRDLRCRWEKSGDLIESITEFPAECKSTIFTKEGPGAGMIILDAASTVCQSRSIVPLVLYAP